MLLGSTATLPPPPSKLIHDDTKDTLSTNLTVSPGLMNLGNTCYLNATLQCLSACPELATQLLLIPQPTKIDYRHTVAHCLGSLFNDLRVSQDTVKPFMFLTTLRLAFSQFGETDSHGYKQQDAVIHRTLSNNIYILKNL